MTDSNDCNTVITIPQTRETCWFNSILMSLFYSQYSRKLLINTNSFSREKNELDVILNMMQMNLFKLVMIVKHKFFIIYMTQHIF